MTAMRQSSYAEATDMTGVPRHAKLPFSVDKLIKPARRNATMRRPTLSFTFSTTAVPGASDLRPQPSPSTTVARRSEITSTSGRDGLNVPARGPTAPHRQSWSLA
jgi:hypothetical protein